jgi:hypothetical protein
MAVTVAPWAVYNSARLHRPVALSNGLGAALAVSNCDATFNGPLLGYWFFPCLDGLRPPAGDGSDQDVAYRRRALEYVGLHEHHLPVVAAARLGRVWGLYRPVELLRIERVVETRELRPAELGLVMVYGLAALSAVAAVLLRRRGGPPALPCLAMAAAVSVTAVLTYGTSRFRAPADVGLVVLGAAGVSLLVDQLRRPRPQPVLAEANVAEREAARTEDRAIALPG